MAFWGHKEFREKQAFLSVFGPGFFNIDRLDFDLGGKISL
jgi:hypothetical protein